MIETFPFAPAIWGYGLSALLFVAFAGLIIARWRGGAKAVILFCTVIFSALWAASIWGALVFRNTELWRMAVLFDAARVGLWLVFLALLIEIGKEESRLVAVALRTIQFFIVPLVLILVGGFLPPPLPWQVATEGTERLWCFYALLAASVYGLVLCEQLYQGTEKNRRWAIKPLIIGLAGMFSFDLLIQTGAILFHQIDAAMWATRGMASAIVIVLVGMATARNATWTVEVHVSRGMVYQSTALLLIGVYLLIVAGAAYWVGFFGGDWAKTLQVAILFAALLGLAALLLSGSLRARLRVMLSKNLFSYRYEYRQEWLRFTRVLGTSEPGMNLYQRVIQALADLVESNGGTMWLERGGVFFEAANLNMPQVSETEPVSGSLSNFLVKTDWVIRLDELTMSPDHYRSLHLPEWLSSQREAWLVVPLPNGAELIGFVVLGQPRVPIDVNWEVRDLLKTASRQAASYLAQFRAKEALVETQKFDAFNRMSAFVVHDLKNLVAQLALVLKNAERHRENPEFQRDVLETVEHAVGRMNQLMLQLRTGTSPVEKVRPVELSQVIAGVIRAKGPRQSIIDLNIESDLRVLGHEDRIERVIGHIVQNALEATEANIGHVRIRIYSDENFAVIAVADDGIGMSEAFIRENLFHPFQTSKPQGMGIGMYESIQYINGIGGRISVESTPGAGTRFDVYVPLANQPAAGAMSIRNIE